MKRDREDEETGEVVAHSKMIEVNQLEEKVFTVMRLQEFHDPAKQKMVSWWIVVSLPLRLTTVTSTTEKTLALGFLVFRLKVDHQYTLGNADLDRRQPDAGCRIHRFEHVRDELVQLVVEFGNRFGHGFEPGIRHFENLSYRHGRKICASRRLFNLNRAHTVIGQPIGLRARSA